MYIPKSFNVTDKEEMISFIESNSFGQLISLVDGKLFSSHIPFLYSEKNQSLLCHLARNNPQWPGLEAQEILITFQGPHDYVSPSWYSSPGVPTWNYQSVHVYGKPRVTTETEKLCSIINEMTKFYESAFEQPWQPEYKESLLKAIVGIEIDITEIQCKYKLSQNRPKEDRVQIIDKHEKRSSTKLSKAAKNNL